VSVRLTPLTDLDAHAMVRELRALPLLEGSGGAGRSGIEALEDLVLRVAAMVYAHPQIVELDCNPVMVSATGAVVADGRVRVAPAPARLPWPSLPAPPPTVIAPDPA
jgi:acyl-CoA synthetase (NDP forming)